MKCDACNYLFMHEGTKKLCCCGKPTCENDGILLTDNNQIVGIQVPSESLVLCAGCASDTIDLFTAMDALRRHLGL